MTKHVREVYLSYGIKHTMSMTWLANLHKRLQSFIETLCNVKKILKEENNFSHPGNRTSNQWTPCYPNG